jgi:AraC-like DNA-binding protein
MREMRSFDSSASSDDARRWLTALLTRCEALTPHVGSSGVGWALTGVRRLVEDSSEPLRPTDWLIVAGVVAHLFEVALHHTGASGAAPAVLVDAHHEILAFIERCAWAAAVPTPRETSEPRIDRVLNYLRTYFRRADLTVHEVARQAGLTRPYLNRLFVQYTGRGVQAHLHDLRVHESRRLLVVTTMSVKQVAAAVGYNDSTQFCRRFKRIYRTAPGAFRRAARAAIRRPPAVRARGKRHPSASNANHPFAQSADE